MMRLMVPPYFGFSVSVAVGTDAGVGIAGVGAAGAGVGAAGAGAALGPQDSASNAMTATRLAIDQIVFVLMYFLLFCFSAI